MLVIGCPSCPHLIAVDPKDGRTPPWCPRCGADLKASPMPAAPSCPATPAEIPHERWREGNPAAAAVTSDRPSADALQVGPTVPLVQSRPILHSDVTLRDEQPAKPAPRPIPMWAFVFAAACALIPVLTLGGAIPGAIGAGGASGCLAVARNPKMDVGTRLGICVAITAGCWTAAPLLLGSAMALLTR